MCNHTRVPCGWPLLAKYRGRFAAKPPAACYRQALTHQVVSYHRILTLLEDREGNLWAGTGPAGRLYLVSPAAASLAFTVADRQALPIDQAVAAAREVGYSMYKVRSEAKK